MKDPVEKLASYLRTTAQHGGGVSGNTRSLAMFLGLSMRQVSDAREYLVATGRLIRREKIYVSIDGFKFGADGQRHEDPDRLFMYLRKHFPAVYDARVGDEPNRVARGIPSEVMIGSVRTGIGFAAALVLCAPGSRISI